MKHLIEETGGSTFGPETRQTTRKSAEALETVSMNCPIKVELTSSVTYREENQDRSKENFCFSSTAEKIANCKRNDQKDLDIDVKGFIKKDQFCNRSEQMEDTHADTLSRNHSTEQAGGSTCVGEAKQTTGESAETLEPVSTNVTQDCLVKVKLSPSETNKEDDQGKSKETLYSQSATEQVVCRKKNYQKDLDIDIESFIKKEIDEILDKRENMENILADLKNVKEKALEYDHTTKLIEKGGNLATPQIQVDTPNGFCDKTIEICNNMVSTSDHTDGFIRQNYEVFANTDQFVDNNGKVNGNTDGVGNNGVVVAENTSEICDNNGDNKYDVYKIKYDVGNVIDKHMDDSNIMVYETSQQDQVQTGGRAYYRNSERISHKNHHKMQKRVEGSGAGHKPKAAGMILERNKTLLLKKKYVGIQPKSVFEKSLKFHDNMLSVRKPIILRQVRKGNCAHQKNKKDEEIHIHEDHTETADGLASQDLPTVSKTCHNNAQENKSQNESISTLQKLTQSQNIAKRVEQLQISLHDTDTRQTSNVPALISQTSDITSGHSRKTLQELLNSKQISESSLKNNRKVATDRLSMVREVTDYYAERQFVENQNTDVIPFTQNTSPIPLSQKTGAKTVKNKDDLLSERQPNDTIAQNVKIPTDGLEEARKVNCPQNKDFPIYDDYKLLPPSLNSCSPTLESISSQTNLETGLKEQNCLSGRNSSDTKKGLYTIKCNENIKHLTGPIEQNRHDTGKSSIQKESFNDVKHSFFKEKMPNNKQDNEVDRGNCIHAEYNCDGNLNSPKIDGTFTENKEKLSEKPEIEALDLIARENQPTTKRSEDNKSPSGETGIVKSSSKVNAWNYVSVLHAPKPVFVKSLASAGTKQVSSNKRSCKRKDVAHTVTSRGRDQWFGGSETDYHSAKKARVSLFKEPWNVVQVEGQKESFHETKLDFPEAKDVKRGSSCNTSPLKKRMHSESNIPCSTSSVLGSKCRDTNEVRAGNPINTTVTDTLMEKKTLGRHTTWCKIPALDKCNDELKSVSMTLFCLPDNMNDFQLCKIKALNKPYETSHTDVETSTKTINLLRKTDRSTALETCEKTAPVIGSENENETDISKNIARSEKSVENLKPAKEKTESGKVITNKTLYVSNESLYRNIDNFGPNNSKAHVINRSTPPIPSPKQKHQYETLQRFLSAPLKNFVPNNSLPCAEDRFQPLLTKNRAQRMTSPKKFLVQHRKSPRQQRAPVSTVTHLRSQLAGCHKENTLTVTLHSVEKCDASTPMRQRINNEDIHNSNSYISYKTENSVENSDSSSTVRNKLNGEDIHNSYKNIQCKTVNSVKISDCSTPVRKRLSSKEIYNSYRSIQCKMMNSVGKSDASQEKKKLNDKNIQNSNKNIHCETVNSVKKSDGTIPVRNRLSSAEIHNSYRSIQCKTMNSEGKSNASQDKKKLNGKYIHNSNKNSQCKTSNFEGTSDSSQKRKKLNGKNINSSNRNIQSKTVNTVEKCGGSIPVRKRLSSEEIYNSYRSIHCKRSKSSEFSSSELPLCYVILAPRPTEYTGLHTCTNVAVSSTSVTMATNDSDLSKDESSMFACKSKPEGKKETLRSIGTKDDQLKNRSSQDSGTKIQGVIHDVSSSTNTPRKKNLKDLDVEGKNIHNDTELNSSYSSSCPGNSQKRITRIVKRLSSGSENLHINPRLNWSYRLQRTGPFQRQNNRNKRTASTESDPVISCEMLSPETYKKYVIKKNLFMEK